MSDKPDSFEFKVVRLGLVGGGHSLSFVIPKGYALALGWKKGDYVQIHVTSDVLSVKKVRPS